MGSWVGLIIGASIGSIINVATLILLAIVGYVMGYMLSDWLPRYLHPNARYRRQFDTDPEAFRHFLDQATFVMMGHLAKADGQVSRKEIDAAERIFKRFKFSASRRQEAIRLFNEGKQAHFDMQSFLQPLEAEAKRHKTLVRVFLEVQAQIVVADDVISQETSRPFVVIAKRLGFTDQQSLTILRQVRARRRLQSEQRTQKTQKKHHKASESHHDKMGDGVSSDFVFNQSVLKEAYQVLNVAPTCSQKSLKMAYRRAMSQYHPDKLHSSGATEQMIEAATEKTQAIQAAYAMITQARQG